MMYERAPSEDPNKAANMPIYVLEVVIFTVPPVVTKTNKSTQKLQRMTKQNYYYKIILSLLSAKLITLRTLILSKIHKLHHQFQGSF